MSSFIVTGATGRVGRALVSLLRSKDLETLCIVRNREKAKDLEALGCQIALADLEDENALARALTSFSSSAPHVTASPSSSFAPEKEVKASKTLILIFPEAFDNEDMLAYAETLTCNVCGAIEKTSDTNQIRRIVLLSSIGADLPPEVGTGFLGTLGVIERILEREKERLGCEMLFVRAGYFMENWSFYLAELRDSPTCFELPTVFNAGKQHEKHGAERRTTGDRKKKEMEEAKLNEAERKQDLSQSPPPQVQDKVPDDEIDGKRRKMAMIAVRDLAEIIAEWVQRENLEGVKVVQAIGPEECSAEDGARVCSEILERTISVRDMQREDVEMMGKQLGWSTSSVGAFLQTAEAVRKGLIKPLDTAKKLEVGEEIGDLGQRRSEVVTVQGRTDLKAFCRQALMW